MASVETCVHFTPQKREIHCKQIPSIRHKSQRISKIMKEHIKFFIQNDIKGGKLKIIVLRVTSLPSKLPLYLQYYFSYFPYVLIKLNTINPLARLYS